MGAELLLPVVTSIIDRLFPDKNQADAAKLKLLEIQNAGELQTIGYQRDVIVAEAQSQSWLANSWRPIIMLMYGFIPVYCIIIISMLNAVGAHIPLVQIPPECWTLLQLGITGYIGGRTLEKITPHLATTASAIWKK